MTKALQATAKQSRTTRRAASEMTSADFKKAAAQVFAFLETDVPEFIHEAVRAAIADAARRSGAPYAKDRDTLAYLLEVTWTLDANVGGFCVTPRQALAEHLAAVMAHPETPSSLYNALGDELTSMTNHINHNTPWMIERALVATSLHEARAKDGT
jgi:hypothetical protein